MFVLRIVVYRSVTSADLGQNPLEQGIIEGENPVCAWDSSQYCVRYIFNESSCLGLQLKVGGKFLLKLNIGERPIANKYREGKMKRTLKRELKVPEIVEREQLQPVLRRVICISACGPCVSFNRLRDFAGTVN